MMLLPVPGTTTGGLTWPPFSAGLEEASPAVDVCMEVGVKVQSAGERPRVLTLQRVSNAPAGNRVLTPSTIIDPVDTTIVYAIVARNENFLVHVPD